jgi:hypothetical protein
MTPHLTALTAWLRHKVFGPAVDAAAMAQTYWVLAVRDYVPSRPAAIEALVKLRKALDLLPSDYEPEEDEIQAMQHAIQAALKVDGTIRP